MGPGASWCFGTSLGPDGVVCPVLVAVAETIPVLIKGRHRVVADGSIDAADSVWTSSTRSI